MIVNPLLYFAYGSNMSSRRLQARVPSARYHAVATLRCHVLRFHKRSIDGSAKCDAFETGADADRVIGVVFEMPQAQQPALDAAEGLGRGYEIKTVELTTDDGRRIEAFMYYATLIDPSLIPYGWYHRHVISGATEFGLPQDYIDAIGRVEVTADPDAARQRRELAIYEDR